jgi:hypothetical protein
MIADTNPWAVAARRVAALGRSESSRTAPTAEVVVEALRVLVWLAGERAAPPHQVRAGASGSVVLSWRQDSDGFQVEVLGPGRLRWLAETGEESGPVGRKLDKIAADLLRSLIPMARRFQPPKE